MAPLPIVAQFMKGLANLQPPLHPPVPAWDLSTILQQLTLSPFELLSSAEMKFVSWKAFLLIAITSARRISELQALVSHPPYTKLHNNRASLRINPRFLPKVAFSFHINQAIDLPSFLAEPHESDEEWRLHTLDCVRVLHIYLQRTASIRQGSQPFVSYDPNRPGRPVTKRTLSGWILGCIAFCLDRAGDHTGDRMGAHQLRALAVSFANLRSVPLADICKAAT